MTAEFSTFLNFPYEFLHFCCMSEICTSLKFDIVELGNEWMFMFIFSFQLFTFCKLTSWLIAGGIVEVRIFLMLHISSIPNIWFLLSLSILNKQLNSAHFINFERKIECCSFYHFWKNNLILLILSTWFVLFSHWALWEFQNILGSESWVLSPKNYLNNYGKL